MKRLFFSLVAVLAASTPARAGSFDDNVDAMFTPLADILQSFIFYKISIAGAELPLVVVWLVAGAVFFSAYLGFINIRGFKTAIKITRGDYADPSSSGEVSHFQALCTAVSGTVGIGNISGIPIAIAMGGPGAVFWMIVAGFLGMSTKFVECTLATKYRRKNPDGSVSGGPMYYIEEGFKEKGFARFGKYLGAFYAIGIIVGCMGIGNMFQSNQAYMQFLVISGGEHSFFADKGWLFGIIFSGIVFAVIVGGIKSIAGVASKLVPMMALLYIVAALAVVFFNWNLIDDAIGLIMTSAFNPQAVGGGVLGVMMIGFQRAVFSNEAGLGSAAIAHSAVKTDEPVTEGFVALLEPFIDTIIVQTITALVIVTTMVAVPDFINSGLRGMEMSSAAFAMHFSFAPYIISLAGLLFAFSTAIAWSYYGLKGVTYLFGETKKGAGIFNIAFCAFFALGCVLDLESIMAISDSLVFIICVPNIFALYLLAPHVKDELKAYMARIKNGDIVDVRAAAKLKRMYDAG